MSANPDLSRVGPQLLEALERIATTGIVAFHINPAGGANIVAEGGDRFAAANALNKEASE